MGAGRPVCWYSGSRMPREAASFSQVFGVVSALKKHRERALTTTVFGSSVETLEVPEIGDETAHHFRVG